MHNREAASGHSTGGFADERAATASVRSTITPPSTIRVVVRY
jgi:hypothetical protein